MKLVGMLDSPYVRRLAISMQLLDIEFEHEALSVFSDFEAFKKINRLVKAPTLICDDGTVLMDSNLILQYLESMAGKRASLWPEDPADMAWALRQTGLALNVCDKSVQYYYERYKRPETKQHQPWVDRVIEQLHNAFSALEGEFNSPLMFAESGHPNQVGISVGVATKFAASVVPAEILDVSQFSQLYAWVDKMEQTQAFKKAEFGEHTYPVWEDSGQTS